LPRIRLALALLAALPLAERAAALTIAPTFAGAGWDATRQAVVEHAVDDWEAAILDPETVSIDFELQPLGSAGPLGQWSGSYTLPVGTDVYPWTPGVDHTIAINTDIAELWWDPTPADDGGDPPFTTWDVLSVVLHEIGHALGFTAGFYVDDFATAGETDKWGTHITGDPPIFDAGGLDVQMAGAANLGHVSDSGATAGDLMVTLLPNGTRRGISDTDLSMLELGYGLSVVSVPEPTPSLLLLGGLALLAARPRRRAPRLS